VTGITNGNAQLEGKVYFLINFFSLSSLFLTLRKLLEKIVNDNQKFTNIVKYSG